MSSPNILQLILVGIMEGFGGFVMEMEMRLRLHKALRRVRVEAVQ